MRTFQHPDNGEHTVASGEAAETLLEEGWVELAEGPYEPPSEEPESQPEPKAPVKPTDPPAPPDPNEGNNGGGTAETPAPEKPLGEMSMLELVAYGEKIGMPDAVALKKPGSSKAKAAEAINAFVASQKK